MLRTVIIACIFLLPVVVLAQPSPGVGGGTVPSGGPGLTVTSAGAPNAVPELPPVLLLAGVSILGFSAARIARR